MAHCNCCYWYFFVYFFPFLYSHHLLFVASHDRVADDTDTNIVPHNTYVWVYVDRQQFSMIKIEIKAISHVLIDRTTDSEWAIERIHHPNCKHTKWERARVERERADRQTNRWIESPTFLGQGGRGHTTRQWQMNVTIYFTCQFAMDDKAWRRWVGRGHA